MQFASIQMLEEYKKKRNFSRTPEPGARPEGKRAPSRPLQPRFVVQEHHASHLHYDFRLEAQGVLKSWAIPKEPSTDPTVKRLAIEVEDHPIAYAGFEGTIPKGEYGAGTVAIWDSGSYLCEDFEKGLNEGKLDIELTGKKLKGAYQLRRLSEEGAKPKWFFFRKSIRQPGARAGELHLKVDGHWIHLSHLDKILYPDAEFTKKQVLNYYRKVAPAILPHLAQRPITLKRYPDGVEGESFYEKRWPPHHPDWFRSIQVRGLDFSAIPDLASLLWVANLASLELHPLLCRAPRIEEPTCVVFDLDPGQGAGLRECAETALLIKAHLEAIGLKCFPKTSGSKGMQVYLPLNTRCTFESSRDFALDVAQKLTRQNPDQITWKMPIPLRKGKVMIDWSQNVNSKTTVAPYSLRAGITPTVSTPVSWDEVRSGLKRDIGVLRFSPDQVLKRIEKNGDLFLPVLEMKQKLPKGPNS